LASASAAASVNSSGSRTLSSGNLHAVLQPGRGAPRVAPSRPERHPRIPISAGLRLVSRKRGRGRCQGPCRPSHWLEQLRRRGERHARNEALGHRC
jgi:hypothetical protein